MSNYTPTGAPATETRGTSAQIRSEFQLIQSALNSKGDPSTTNTWTQVQTFNATNIFNATQSFLAGLTLTGTAIIANQQTSGSATFTNVTINGLLDMNAGSGATVTGLSAPTLDSDAATKAYVDSSINALVTGAPGTMDTLNEIAAALGDDPNFAATMTAQLALKLDKSGGTMSGPIACVPWAIQGC